MRTHNGMPILEFAFPGRIRDSLVAAVLDGRKTSTTTTIAEYALEAEELPVVGQRHVVVDSADRPVAVVETTRVRTVALRDVDLDHVIAEGEGDTSIEQWRESHLGYWHSDDMRDYMGDPGYTVTDDTPLLLEGFRVVELLG